ncbi:MAG: glycosyltransferase family 4 protein [bacterium]
MNILQINSYYIGSKIYKNLYQKLDNKNIKQQVFVPVKRNEKKENNYIDLKNGEIIYRNTFNTLDRVLYYTKVNKSYKSVIDNINLENINLVHAHSLFINGGIANKLKKEKGIKYITAVRSTDVVTFFKYMIHLRKKGIEILKNAEKIIFISPAYKSFLIDNYIPKNIQKEIERKSVVIPNGINDYWLNNKVEPGTLSIYDSFDNEINLIYAGQFIKRKQVDKVILAVEKLANEGYNIKFNIIGKGPQKRNIEKKIAENLGLFNMHGYLNKEELLDMYRQSDIFIMPSYNETFGLVYIEAMSQGLPIIYTRNEGVDGYFKEGSVGYAVNPDDIDDIVEKIKKIAGNYAEMSDNAVKEAQRFSWDKVSDQYIKIYKGLVSKK